MPHCGRVVWSSPSNTPVANHLAAPINFPEKRNGIRTCQLQKKVLQLLSRTQGGVGKTGYYTPLAKGNLHHLQLTVSDIIGYTSSFSIEDVVLVKKHIDEGLQDHGSTTWQLIQGHGTCLPQEGRGMPPRQKRGSEECFLALTEAHDRLVICQHWHRISSTTWSWRRSHEMLRLNRQLLFLIWPVMIQ